MEISRCNSWEQVYPNHLGQSWYVPTIRGVHEWCTTVDVLFLLWVGWLGGVVQMDLRGWLAVVVESGIRHLRLQVFVSCLFVLCPVFQIPSSLRVESLYFLFVFVGVFNLPSLALPLCFSLGFPSPGTSFISAEFNKPKVESSAAGSDDTEDDKTKESSTADEKPLTVC